MSQYTPAGPTGPGFDPTTGQPYQPSPAPMPPKQRSWFARHKILTALGAIVVLVLFALMLTRATIGPHPEIDTAPWQRAVASALGAATSALLASVLLPFFASDDVAADVPGTPQIGAAIFGTWVWPFELLSVLLLVALITAFAVSRLVLRREGEVR